MTQPAMQYDRRETSAWITKPIVIMAVYLWVAKRKGAFDAL